MSAVAIPKSSFSGERSAASYVLIVHSMQGDDHDLYDISISICIRERARRVGQLFSLGHVSGASKSVLTGDQIGSTRFWRTDHQHVPTQVSA
jgi:hypothetical protein